MKASFLCALLLCLSYGIINCQIINGITFVAPPKSVGQEAFTRLQETHANWLCFVPYAFVKKGQTEIRFSLDKQWWGETSTGINACLDLSKKTKFNAMLKPQVFVPNGWIGEIDFQTEEEWVKFEKSYETYIMAILEFAITHNVEMFCVGTELRLFAKKREKFWRKLIKNIRSKYKGKLTYSANWDDYENVPFWDELDYIGVSAYFPLIDMKTPTINSLNVKWKKICAELKTYSKNTGKKILFTEYGYLTVDHCASKTWELESKIQTLKINQEAQANAFESLYQSIWNQPFFAGGFIWKWFPNGMGHEGYKDKDYDPQNKLAEAVVKKYYSQK
ncbi:MAG: hypothetical protein RLZZ546_3248 [Bacteroidota bacterium]|jgi:hypothetical protein